MSAPSEYGRLPTLELLERELVRRADAEPRFAPPQRRLVVAFAVILLAALMAATPQGRALAERIADLVKVGGLPSRELVEPVGEPAVVIGLGETPAGERFEIVASTAPPAMIGAATCISIDLPDSRGAAAFTCFTPAVAAAMEERGITAVTADTPRLSPYTAVMGFARPAATGVDVVVRSGGRGSTRHPASLARLGPQLADRIGADERVAFFVAFIPPARARGDVRATAYGRDGSPLASEPVTLAPVPPPGG